MVARARKTPACFGLSWDPGSTTCTPCRVQGPCATEIAESALAANLITIDELRSRRGLSAEAASIIGHTIAHIRGTEEREEPPAEIPPTFDRWQAEREARPAIARIQPGEELRRDFDGAIHVVRCCFGYWLYRETRYPTLASVVRAIAGARQYPRQRRAGGVRPEGTRTGAICSAARFFKLQEKRRDTSSDENPRRTDQVR